MNRTRMVIASAIAACLLVIALLVSYFLDVERHGVTVTPTFHVGLFEGSVWFYSHEWPYRGSIIQLEGGPPILKRRGFNFPGIYYRYFRFSAHTIWTLRVSLWYPVFLFAIPPAVWLIHRRRLQLRRKETL